MINISTAAVQSSYVSESPVRLCDERLVLTLDIHAMLGKVTGRERGKSSNI